MARINRKVIVCKIEAYAGITIDREVTAKHGHNQRSPASREAVWEAIEAVRRKYGRMPKAEREAAGIFGRWPT